MNRFLFLVLMLCMAVHVESIAQVDSIPPLPDGDVVVETPKDTVWRRGASMGVNFSNVSLSNWSGGGQNAMALTSVFLGNLDYAKKRVEWHNLIDLAYGFQRLGDKSAPFRKSDDRIYAQTKLSYAHSAKLKYATLADFRSQFAQGYKYYDEIQQDSSELISNFLAPAYVTFSIGIEYLPVKNMSLYLSPLAVKMTIVNDTYLSNMGAFGVTPGQRIRTELGASFIGRYKADIAKNVSFATQLSLFNNYENVNVDVYWDCFLYLKINKFLTTTFTTNLIYDDDINVVRNDDSVGPAVQFKNVLAVGLVYKLNGYGVR